MLTTRPESDLMVSGAAGASGPLRVICAVAGWLVSSLLLVAVMLMVTVWLDPGGRLFDARSVALKVFRMSKASTLPQSPLQDSPLPEMFTWMLICRRSCPPVAWLLLF